ITISQSAARPAAKGNAPGRQTRKTIKLPHAAAAATEPWPAPYSLLWRASHRYPVTVNAHATALPVVGNVLAAGSAVAWAFTVTGYRWLARQRSEHGAGHGPIAAAAACGNLIVFLACLPAALPLAAGRPTDWVIVIYLGVFQLGLAYVFLSRAITRVPALEASLFLLVEPVLSPVWAWLAHGETPGPLAAIGGVVILAATALKSWRDTAVVAA